MERKIDSYLEVKNYGTKTKIEFDHEDMSGTEWINAFYTAMVGITFLPETIENVMSEFLGDRGWVVYKPDELETDEDDERIV